MTKFYCDMCHKEIKAEKRNKMSIRNYSDGVLKSGDFCDSCKQTIMELWKNCEQLDFDETGIHIRGNGNNVGSCIINNYKGEE